MTDSRRYLGSFAVASLVLLRLVVGGHFFTQGLEKIEYDPLTKQVRIPFSAAGFLSQAKGPLAELYHAQVPGGHNWQQVLAAPRQNVPLTKEVEAERKKWVSEYTKQRVEAEKNGTEAAIEFPPFAPYSEWATRIGDAWQAALDKASAVRGLSDEQKQQLKKAYAARRQELADYLDVESEAMIDYQHQLWRLANWEAAPESASLPFQGERIAKKRAETARTAQPWVAQVGQLEQLYLSDLGKVLTPEQQADATTSAAMAEAQMRPGEKWLNFVNMAVTGLTIGVGVCLLLGLFTRLASLAGALFLLSVIASQPPWVADAAPTISQSIEFASLLVLAGAGAGRWLGLDFFGYALFHRCGGETHS